MPRDPRSPDQRAADRYAAFRDLLQAERPDGDRVIVGWHGIHAYLTNVLRLRRRNGRPLTFRQLQRWRERQGLPVGGGGELIPGPKGLRRTLCFTTSNLLQAWACSRVKPGRLFLVSYPPRYAARIGGCEHEPPDRSE